MTIAFTCVLIAILLPYGLTYYMKSGLIKSGTFDNRAPRAQLAQRKGRADGLCGRMTIAMSRCPRSSPR